MFNIPLSSNKFLPEWEELTTGAGIPVVWHFPVTKKRRKLKLKKIISFMEKAFKKFFYKDIEVSNSRSANNANFNF